MTQLMTAFWADEHGFILSAELVLVSTIVVLGMVAALVCVRDAVTCELTDVANSIRSMNQSYFFRGMRSWGWCGTKAWTAGSFYYDQVHYARVGGVVERGGAVINQGGAVIQQDFVCPPEGTIVTPPCEGSGTVPCPPANGATCPTPNCPVCPPDGSDTWQHAEPLVW